MSKAGKWELNLSNAYPVWGSLFYEGREISGIHHKDLRDLEYVVKRAILEARDKLPLHDKNEMD